MSTNDQYEDDTKTLADAVTEGPEQDPGNPEMQRPSAPFVSLPHDTAPVIPFAETGHLGPIPGAMYGLMAEYADGTSLAAAARAARKAGYRKLEAHMPHPVHEVFEALEYKRTLVPLIVLVGGILGMIGGYGLEFWTQVIDYPLNVGGRPLHSWPLFLPVAFETTILGAGLSAIFGMLAMNGLPMPYHPVFNVAQFNKASTDGFFLVVEATDPKFNYAEAKSFLASSGASEVYDVPH